MVVEVSTMNGVTREAILGKAPSKDEILKRVREEKV